MIIQNFDKDQNILFVDNSGRLEFEALKTYFSSLKDNSHLTKNLFVLEDARKVNVKFGSEHLVRLSKALCDVAKSYIEVHHAVVLDGSRDVAYAMIINEGIAEENYFLKVFSDKDFALEWVKNKSE